MIQCEIIAGTELIARGGARLRQADVALLLAIRQCGSVAQAARASDHSYRHAWGRIAGINDWAGRTWVSMERGRGAVLSPECIAVLDAVTGARDEMQDSHRRLSSRLNLALAAAAQRRQHGLRWRLSSDLLIEEMLPHVRGMRAIGTGLKFGGSMHNLQALAAGECELAGFHIPGTRLRARLRRLASLHPGLADGGIRLMHLMDRTQGLMVAKGNPKRIRRIADLVRRGVRFINRQKNSGSRELFDEMLKAQRVDRRRIQGYAHEEFTHFAVAAAVASGMADTAFGIEAAARRLGLDFVPLAEESYFVAASAETMAAAESAEVFDWFRSAEAVSLAESLGGYVLRVSDPEIGF